MCMCLLGIYLQPCCWMDVEAWQQPLLSHAVEYGLMLSHKKSNFFLFDSFIELNT